MTLLVLTVIARRDSTVTCTVYSTAKALEKQHNLKQRAWKLTTETNSFLLAQPKLSSPQSRWTDKSWNVFCLPWIPMIRLEQSEGLVGQRVVNKVLMSPPTRKPQTSQGLLPQTSTSSVSPPSSRAHLTCVCRKRAGSSRKRAGSRDERGNYIPHSCVEGLRCHCLV